MEKTTDFVQRVQRRFASFLNAARTSHPAEDAAREAAITQTTKAMTTDGYFGLTQKDVRRIVETQQ